MGESLSEEEKTALKQLQYDAVNNTLEGYELSKLPQTSDLSDCLRAYTKSTLFKLAKVNGVKMKKSWKKDRIVDEVEKVILRTLEERLLSFTGVQIEWLNRFLNGGSSEEEISIEKADFFLTVFPVAIELGLVFAKTDGHMLSAIVSKEMRGRLDNIQGIKGEQEQEEVNYKMIEEVVLSAVNLYGVVDKEQLVDLWKLLYPDFKYAVEFYEYFYQIIPIVAIANGFIQVDDNLLASPGFEDDHEVWLHRYTSFEKLKTDYYQPSREELYYYAKHRLDKRSFSYKKLAKLIAEHSVDPETTMEIIEYHIKFGNDISDAMEELNELELLEFDSQKQVEKFIGSFLQSHSNVDASWVHTNRDERKRR